MPDMFQTADATLPELRPNNLYLLQWMRQANRPGFRAMDYGCGDGALVFWARSENIDSYGAETYYDGARPEDLALVRKYDPETKLVRTIVDNKLPFADGFLEMVVANQVFEHIQDLPGTAAEIARVLKPGGTLVSIFPTRGVIREPHLWVPFMHRFPKGRLRRLYFKTGRKFSRRARANWGVGEAEIDRAFWFMDTHTCYRTPGEVKKIFDPLFDVRFIEPNWLAFRLPKLARLRAIPGARLAATIFARLGAGAVIVATKRG